MNEAKCPTRVELSIAIENMGLRDGFKWLVKSVISMLPELGPRVIRDVELERIKEEQRPSRSAGEKSKSAERPKPTKRTPTTQRPFPASSPSNRPSPGPKSRKTIPPNAPPIRPAPPAPGGRVWLPARDARAQTPSPSSIWNPSTIPKEKERFEDDKPRKDQCRNILTIIDNGPKIFTNKTLYRLHFLLA